MCKAGALLFESRRGGTTVGSRQHVTMHQQKPMHCRQLVTDTYSEACTAGSTQSPRKNSAAGTSHNAARPCVGVGVPQSVITTKASKQAHAHNAVGHPAAGRQTSRPCAVRRVCGASRVTQHRAPRTQAAPLFAIVASGSWGGGRRLAALVPCSRAAQHALDRAGRLLCVCARGVHCSQVVLQPHVHLLKASPAGSSSRQQGARFPSSVWLSAAGACQQDVSRRPQQQMRVGGIHQPGELGDSCKKGAGWVSRSLKEGLQCFLQCCPVARGSGFVTACSPECGQLVECCLELLLQLLCLSHLTSIVHCTRCRWGLVCEHGRHNTKPWLCD